MSISPANDDPRNDAVSLDEQLVAYLDGELDGETSRRIETQLATDAHLRERLQELQRTWDLLGELDRDPVDDDFTRSTLEMVALKATEDARESNARDPRRRWWLMVVASVTVACVAGFLAVAWLRPSPNRRLLEDLPVLENLDPYWHAGNIQFLRMLSNEHLFDRDPTSGDEGKP